LAKITKIKGGKYNNPEFLTLEIIGGKWKMPIIWSLSVKSMRYGELKKTFPNVTHKMLTQQLRELEKDELITRKVYSQIPPKVEYSLTLLGKSALPVIEMLIEWGNEYKRVFE
jgi:DNA-binding HxlR family transcriptional regulator